MLLPLIIGVVQASLISLASSAGNARDCERASAPGKHLAFLRMLRVTRCTPGIRPVHGFSWSYDIISNMTKQDRPPEMRLRSFRQSSSSCEKKEQAPGAQELICVDFHQQRPTAWFPTGVVKGVSQPFNPFSQESKEMIHEVGNVELCELLDMEPKAQCKVCLSYWDVGIVYCTCGHFLRNGTEENRKFVQYTMELLSIPNYCIKKGRPHGHRYGKKPRDYEYFVANSLKKKCKKRGFWGIHDE